MKRLLVVIICAVFVSGCYLLAPNSGYVVSSTKFKDGKLALTDNFKSIKRERELRRDYYFVSGLSLIANDFERLWDVDCESENMEKMTPLPDSIIFGEFSCVEGEIGTMKDKDEVLTLPFDTLMHLGVSVIGVNKNNKDRIDFTVQSYEFKLKDTNAGIINVIHYGDEGF